MKNEPILFNSYTEEWNIFSNMFPLPFRYKGRWFKSIEHFYHYYKVHKSETGQRLKILNTYNPFEAKSLGSERGIKINPHHNVDKLTVMERGIFYAYMQNPNHMLALQKTGKRPLIHLSPWDEFWGNGKTGKGANQQGILLMKFRDEHRDDDPFELARTFSRAKK